MKTIKRIFNKLFKNNINIGLISKHKVNGFIINENEFFKFIIDYDLLYKCFNKIIPGIKKPNLNKTQKNFDKIDSQLKKIHNDYLLILKDRVNSFNFVKKNNNTVYKFFASDDEIRKFIKVTNRMNANRYLKEGLTSNYGETYFNDISKFEPSIKEYSRYIEENEN